MSGINWGACAPLLCTCTMCVALWLYNATHDDPKFLLVLRVCAADGDRHTQPNVESANSRYFRLQPDALEYYRNEQAVSAFGGCSNAMHSPNA